MEIVLLVAFCLLMEGLFTGSEMVLIAADRRTQRRNDELAAEEKLPPPPVPAVTTVVPSTPAPPPAPEPVAVALAPVAAVVAAPQYGPRDGVFVRLWRWLAGDKSARRPPELLTRDEVARAIYREVKAEREFAAQQHELDLLMAEKQLLDAEHAMTEFLHLIATEPEIARVMPFDARSL